jgi:hypothetical protein
MDPAATLPVPLEARLVHREAPAIDAAAIPCRNSPTWIYWPLS